MDNSLHRQENSRQRTDGWTTVYTDKRTLERELIDGGQSIQTRHSRQRADGWRAVYT